MRALADSTEGLLDWDNMVKLLAEAEPAWEVGTRSAYHALTYGYLVGEVDPPGDRTHRQRGAPA